MLSLLRRFKELLVVGVLLIYPFVSFLIRGHQPREPHFLDRFLIGTSSVIQRSVLWACDGMASGWSGYVALRGVRTDNELLVQENLRLRGEESRHQEISLENERLRKLLAYNAEREGEKIPARVVGVNPVSTTLSLRLDRGEKQGIGVSMPVITPDGVVGQIVRTTGSYSDVALLSDPASKVGVRIQRSRARATAVGAGNGENLRLGTALRTDDIQEGDVVVTSGTDGLFPAGLVVGKIQGLQRREHGMFIAADIVPAVDTARLEEVLVISSANAALPDAVPMPAVTGGSP